MITILPIEEYDALNHHIIKLKQVIIMNFSYYYLGPLTAGQRLSVKVNQQAHVALLDTQNLNRYTRRQNFRHYGKLQSYYEENYYIPASGEWHIVIYSSSKIPDMKSKITLK